MTASPRRRLIHLLLILVLPSTHALIANNDWNLWALRAASAAASYVGLVVSLDRPQGELLLNTEPDDWYSIAPSSVPGAGLGLYSRRDLKQGTVLGTYPGVVLPLRPHATKLQQYPHCEGYIWRFSDNRYVIDPTNAEGLLEEVCRGGNPQTPFSVALCGILSRSVPTVLCRINEPPKGKDVNVVTDEDLERRTVTFSLERDVLAGEELFIDYGLYYDRSMYGRVE